MILNYEAAKYIVTYTVLWMLIVFSALGLIEMFIDLVCRIRRKIRDHKTEEEIENE